jgi:hypothetical protein
MRSILFAFFIASTFLNTHLVYAVDKAVDRVDISAGNITRPASATPPLNSFNIGFSWDTDFFKSDDGFIQRSVRIEAGLGLHKTDEAEIKSILLAPVLRYELAASGTKPFFEISVGPAHLSETRWEADHDLSTRWTFADRIGIGYSFEKIELSLNFFHFSNGGLSTHNPGADMVLIRSSFKI